MEDLSYNFKIRKFKQGQTTCHEKECSNYVPPSPWCSHWV